MKIHAKIDDFIELLMAKLCMQIPEFKLTRHFTIKAVQKEESKASENENTKPVDLKNSKTIVYGCDKKGAPYDLFKSTKITTSKEGETEVTLEFQGHYNEPLLKVKVPQDLLSKQ
jgi:hypothetical protein